MPSRQFFQLRGMSVYPRQCELLLQTLLVTVVGVDVDRLLVQERVVEAIDPLPYPLDASLDRIGSWPFLRSRSRVPRLRSMLMPSGKSQRVDV